MSMRTCCSMLRRRWAKQNRLCMCVLLQHIFLLPLRVWWFVHALLSICICWTILSESFTLTGKTKRHLHSNSSRKLIYMSCILTGRFTVNVLSYQQASGPICVRGKHLFWWLRYGSVPETHHKNANDFRATVQRDTSGVFSVLNFREGWEFNTSCNMEMKMNQCWSSAAWNFVGTCLV